MFFEMWSTLIPVSCFWISHRVLADLCIGNVLQIQIRAILSSIRTTFQVKLLRSLYLICKISEVHIWGSYQIHLVFYHSDSQQWFDWSSKFLTVLVVNQFKYVHRTNYYKRPISLLKDRPINTEINLSWSEFLHYVFLGKVLRTIKTKSTFTQSFWVVFIKMALQCGDLWR